MYILLYVKSKSVAQIITFEYYTMLIAASHERNARQGYLIFKIDISSSICDAQNSDESGSNR